MQKMKKELQQSLLKKINKTSIQVNKICKNNICFLKSGLFNQLFKKIGLGEFLSENVLKIKHQSRRNIKIS